MGYLNWNEGKVFNVNSKKKLGFWSIFFFGFNCVVGSGIFLIPGEVMKAMGPGGIWVYIFDTILAMAIALCFAEVAGLFDKNGGAFVYVQAAFGDFVGFEVGIMKYISGAFIWSVGAVGVATSLESFWPGASNYKTIIAVLIVTGLSLVNIIGVSKTKNLNNVITISKLVPLILFIAIGVFFITGANFTPMFPSHITTTSFSTTAILIFFAFTGFETIAIAAEDYENPKKVLPKVIIAVMIASSLLYVLVQIVCVGVLGPKLAASATPVADAANVLLGSWGGLLVTAGIILSMFSACISSSFMIPRLAEGLAEGGLLPRIVAKKSKFGTPYVAIILTGIITAGVSLIGNFSILAEIGVIAAFAQYIPTVLSVIVFRKRNKGRDDLKGMFRIPFGPVLPILSLIVVVYLLTQTPLLQIIVGLGGLVLAVPLYFIIKKTRKLVVENNEEIQK